jgi:hypothetical protein
VKLRSEVARRLRADLPLSAREAVYEFERNGLSAISVLWLTSADGFFIKLRLSMRTEIADELDDARDQILGSIAEAIHARERGTQAAPPPAATAAAPASIELDAGGDSADAPMWLAYAMELSRYAAENPDTAPPCGGIYVPRFELEVEGLRAALREYHARPANNRHSAYFDALSRVEAAGLLDEYAWALLHEASWGKAPDHELAMGAFEEFRARELPGHVAQSGAHVRIRAVRVLTPPTAP